MQPRNKRFCELLQEALADEYKAPELYQKLVGAGKDALVREVFISIIREEDNHAKLLEVIKSLRCPIK